MSDTDYRREVAATILEQLGGAGFIRMTGARQFVVTEGGLKFRIPGNMTRGRINGVEVTLDPDDTYTVTFCVIRKFKVCSQIIREGIFCDCLPILFRDETGLETRMPKIINL